MLTMRNQLVAAIEAPSSSPSLSPYCSKLRFITITLYVFLAISTPAAVESRDTNHLVLATKETPPASWQFIKINHTKIDNLITDARDGSIFVTSGGEIFKYSNELTLTDSWSSRTYINKLLTLINEDKLLSCGQVNANASLTCVVHNPNRLNSSVDLTWSNGNHGLKFISDSAEQIVVSQDHQRKNTTNQHLLMVTRRDGFSGKQLEQVFGSTPSSAYPPYYVPAVARLELEQPQARSLHEATAQLNVNALLPYQPRVKGDKLPLYDYLYTFAHESYTYFVLNDIEGSPQSTPGDGLPKLMYDARMARVCNNDTKLTSYVEVNIVCEQAYEARSKVAYFDGKNSTLYVVFEGRRLPESGGGGDGGDGPKDSYLCSYSMKKVQNAFGRAVTRCHNANKPAKLLAKLHPPGSPLACVRCSLPKQLQDGCSSILNPYIDGLYKEMLLEPETRLKLAGRSGANFLLSLTQGRRPSRVHFIAFANGRLTKLTKLGVLFTVDIVTHGTRAGTLDDKVKHLIPDDDDEDDGREDIRFSFAKGNITAIDNKRGEIHQLPIDTCQYYATCYACHTVQDPLECVWCGDRCERASSANETTTTTTCAPSIYAFSPPAGPTSGSTTLIILGDGLGGESSQPTITVGGQECLLDANRSDSNKIECQVEPVGEPHEAIISVSLSDTLSNGVRLEGTATSSVLYQYKHVSIFGIAQPATGPSEGGTEVFIEGENLDVGRQRNVWLGGTGCEILRSEPTRIVCKTKSYNLTASRTGASSEETLIQEPLKVYIDGIWPVAHKQHENLSEVFTFKLEPIPSSLFDVFNIFLALIFIVAPLVLLTAYLAHGKYGGDGGGGGGKQEGIITRPSTACSRSLSPTGTDDSTRPNSLTGLVKLDGNNMSGNYFAPGLCEKLPNSLLSDKMRSLLGREGILIDRNRLTLGHVLGAGQFARVYKGYLRPEGTAGVGEYTPVAVKTLHEKSLSSKVTDGTSGEDFLEEGLIMRDFAHPNVLGLIGVAFDTSGLPMVITPFMLYGDLKSYVCDGEFSPDTEELIGFGVQIARGMAYLASLKFVHRDLAARNCMLDENKVVKVADFGLSRDIYERDYYSSESRGAKLPVKWMAIESLAGSHYSTKSDVWSYGVLLWELLAPQPGLVPYSDVDNFDILNYLRAGRRLMRPRNCPVNLYKIMQACWQADPSARPTFSELVKSMSEILEQPKDELGQGEEEPNQFQQTVESNRLEPVVEPNRSLRVVEQVAAPKRPLRVSLPEMEHREQLGKQDGQPPDEVEPQHRTSAEVEVRQPPAEAAEPQVSGCPANEAVSPAPVVCIMQLQARQAKTHSVDLDQMSLAEQARYLGVAFHGFCFDRIEDDEATESQE